MHPDDNQLSALHRIFVRYVPMPIDSWSLIVPHLQANAYSSGEHILQAGDPVTSLSFIIKGLARHYYLSKRGKEYNKAFTNAGQLLSNLPSLLCGISSSLYIQALRPSVCLSITYAEFLHLCECHPEWERVRTRLLEQALLNKEQRITELLLFNASERYEHFLASSPDLASTIPNYHIASYLGITDVALSRIRKRLGFIRQHSRYPDGHR
ncbi:MAG TPA: Crp/Fnr family transcriptional regulator [Gammaproteobacteria bacterium]